MQTIRLLRARPGAFPALEIEAALPARATGPDTVSADLKHVDQVDQEAWAAELTGVLADHPAAVRALDGCPGGWSYAVCVLPADEHDDDVAAAGVWFVVRAAGLPADEFEALASGYDVGELVVAWGPPPGSRQAD